MRCVLSLIVLSLLTIPQTGCLLFVAGAAAGTGATVAYVKGDLNATVEADPQRIAQATERAAKDLDLVMVSNESSKVDAKVVTRTARDVRLVVVATSTSENLSKVSIRVGTFGDDGLQQRMLDKIKANLAPTTNPTATADGSK